MSASDRSTRPLFALWSLLIAIMLVLEFVLPLAGWVWVVTRLGIPVVCVGLITASARWYLHAGRLPRWWPS